jgi:MFS family permease
LLPRSPRLRRILLAYTVNELGTWFGYVALALGVYDHTHDALATAGLFVARGLLPALLAPLLVAHVERSPRRGGLAALYCVEGVLALALAVLLWRFSLVGVLILVAFDGIAAVAATALVRACAAREATAPGTPEAAQRQANAALNVAFMLGLTIGPAIGGVLVRTIGGPLALVIDAGTFWACALLLLGLHSHVHEGAEDSVRARLLAAWRHIWEVPQLRVLLLTEAVAIVFFASVEPVEVIYAKATLHAGDAGFGALMGIWGAGAALGALVFARRVHRPLAPLLTGGTLLVGVAYLGFAAAPTFAIACTAAFVGGTGNGVQWPSLISAVQQLTPPYLQGRMMSAVGSLNALCPALGFLLGGTLVALDSTRLALTVAGSVATLATLAFLRLPLHGLRPASEPRPMAIADAELPNTIR